MMNWKMDLYSLFFNSCLSSFCNNKIKCSCNNEKVKLTEVAGEGGADLAPQKFSLSQKFRHLMKCKKYLENYFYLAYFLRYSFLFTFLGVIQNGRQRSEKGHRSSFLIFWRNFVRMCYSWVLQSHKVLTKSDEKFFY